jgi:hypothetical protein
MRRPPRLRARFATAGTGEGEGETSSGFVSSSDFDFASPEVAFADGLGVFFSPAPGGSGEARDAGGACLLLGAIPRARRRRRCASGNARVRVWGWRDRACVRGVGRTRQDAVRASDGSFKARGKEPREKAHVRSLARWRLSAVAGSPRFHRRGQLGAREDVREREPALARIGSARRLARSRAQRRAVL